MRTENGLTYGSLNHEQMNTPITDLKRRLQTLKQRGPEGAFYCPFGYQEILEMVDIMTAMLELQGPPSQELSKQDYDNLVRDAMLWRKQRIDDHNATLKTTLANPVTIAGHQDDE
jgi:hypothetical protein